MQVNVRHWRYEDGWCDIPIVLRDKNAIQTQTREFREEIVGWHCRAYADNDFENWMEQNMKGKYDCTFRFNSGDPMYTIHICNNEDAILFKLIWM
jgi:hypothetical protein